MFQGEGEISLTTGGTEGERPCCAAYTCQQSCCQCQLSLTCPSLVPHLSLTCPSLVPHLSLTCPSLVPHLSLTCPSLVPHLSLSCPSLVPHLSLTCPSLVPPFTPVSCLLSLLSPVPPACHGELAGTYLTLLWSQ